MGLREGCPRGPSITHRSTGGLLPRAFFNALVHHRPIAQVFFQPTGPLEACPIGLLPTRRSTEGWLSRPELNPWVHGRPVYPGLPKRVGPCGGHVLAGSRDSRIGCRTCSVSMRWPSACQASANHDHRLPDLVCAPSKGDRIRETFPTAVRRGVHASQFCASTSSAVAVANALILRGMAVVAETEAIAPAPTCARQRRRWRAIAAGAAIGVHTTVPGHTPIARAVHVGRSVARTGLAARTITVASTTVVRAEATRWAELGDTAAIHASVAAPAVAGACPLGWGCRARAVAVPSQRGLPALLIALPMVVGHV
jgi:hypothetical protein